jgi:predicted Zn-dependent peptidase
LDWETSALDNGLRVTTIKRQGTGTAAVRFYLRAGSRFDGDHLGKAHFLEHLLFKGTTTRTPQQIYAAIEAHGGDINAVTTREYSSFRTVTLPEDLYLALDLLGDVLINPLLTETSFHKEKLIVLNEIMSANDQMGILGNLFIQTLWKQNSLRNPILGTVECLRDLQHEHVLKFYNDKYVTENTVLVMCGDIDHDDALSAASQNLGDFHSGPEQLPVLLEEPFLDSCRESQIEKDIHQTYVMIGVPTVGMKHPDRSAIKVIELALGMGGSGRLFQRLREDEQIVYSVNTFSAIYEDVGFLGIRAACAPENLTAVRETVLQEWQSIKEKGLSSEEILAVKGHYAGRTARHFETNGSIAGIVGIEGLLSKVETFEEAIARINSVTEKEVIEKAQRYLDHERYAVAIVGRKLDN